MRYADLKYNDIVDCKSGICVSYWCQGCPIHCEGCHNQQTWDFSGGKEIERDELIKQIINAISANGVKRNFSVLGGEPLAHENVENTYEIIKAVRNKFPDIKIYLWTGFTLGQLYRNIYCDLYDKILCLIDVLVEGPYEKDKRDITLPLRGSTNQKVIYLNEENLNAMEDLQ